MAGLAAMGGMVGGVGVIAAAAAVFLSGPPLLVKIARTCGVLGVVLGLGGALRDLQAAGFQLEPTRGGSLFAVGGMLLLTFGAARAAETRRATRDRERWMAEQRARRSK